MPELPEVETVRRGLAAALGLPFRRNTAEESESRIDFAALPRLRRWHFARSTLRYPLPIPALESLKGMRLLAVERRSKYLLLYFVRPKTQHFSAQHFSQAPNFWEMIAGLPNWAAERQLCRVLVHLGMSGRLRIANTPPKPARHDHLWLRLTAAQNGAERDFTVIYNDARRFGFWLFEAWPVFGTNDAAAQNVASAPFCRVGLEPLPLEEYRLHAPFTLAWDANLASLAKTAGQALAAGAAALAKGASLAKTAVNDTRPIAVESGKLGAELHGISRQIIREIKPWILEGRAVCGVGNIYCCESLWLAGLSPHKSAHSLSLAEAETLAGALQRCIAGAVSAGGTTIRDFHGVGGEGGYFQQELCVYQREGQPCLRPGCTTKIEKCTQAQRSTFYCPGCQA